MADRVNFDRGRVDPNLSVNMSVGADVYNGDRVKFGLQGDVENLNNRLNVINFNGLYSGNAIGPARSWFLRWTTTF